jgi:hypothetical protein
MRENDMYRLLYTVCKNVRFVGRELDSFEAPWNCEGHSWMTFIEMLFGIIDAVTVSVNMSCPLDGLTTSAQTRKRRLTLSGAKPVHRSQASKCESRTFQL